MYTLNKISGFIVFVLLLMASLTFAEAPKNSLSLDSAVNVYIDLMHESASDVDLMSEAAEIQPADLSVSGNYFAISERGGSFQVPAVRLNPGHVAYGEAVAANPILYANQTDSRAGWRSAYRVAAQSNALDLGQNQLQDFSIGAAGYSRIMAPDT